MNYRIDLALQLASCAMGLWHDEGLCFLKQEENKAAALAMLGLMAVIDEKSIPLVMARKSLNGGNIITDAIIDHAVTVEDCLLKGRCFPEEGVLLEQIIKLERS